MMRLRSSWLRACLILLACTMLFACDTKELTRKHVRLAYVEWASERASANLIKVLLERQGYQVEIIPVSAAAMWQSVAEGYVDVIVGAWLPETHRNYWRKVKGKVEDLGVNMHGTQLGLVVPTYMQVNSIGQLNQYAKACQRQIIGVDPGSGVMIKTEEAINAYHLDFKLVQGSGAIMTAALSAAINRHQPIVITGWAPHWMFDRWSLKFLQDPKHIYGKEGDVHTIVRRGLQQDKPFIYDFFKRFHWTRQQMQQLMLLNEKPHSDPYENAKRWLLKHPDFGASFSAASSVEE